MYHCIRMQEKKNNLGKIQMKTKTTNILFSFYMLYSSPFQQSGSKSFLLLAPLAEKCFKLLWID